jgi:DNA repair exonuclease SbcCD ATPase subunit
MIITKLMLENWMKIQQLTLEFKQGINLVYGPNEIGKSSIVEAIRLAFTGDAASGNRKYKDLQPWSTEARAKVELSFTTGDERHFQVRKSFPKGSAALLQKGILLAEDPKKTQEKLLQVLGINEKTLGLFHLLFINQGETLNIFAPKDNPLDENTRAYIKDVIKETAFKPLQEFQDSLNRERELIFTTGGKLKAGRDASEYKQLLDKEKELKQRKEELEEKVTGFSRRLEEMEVLDTQINRLINEKKEKEKFLSTLKTKKVRLEELEKKRLEFEPIKNDYNRFLDIQEKIEEINRQLPRLYAHRQQTLSRLEQEIHHLETQRLEKQRYLEALKLKKFTLDKEIAVEKLNDIQGKIRQYSKKQEELQEVEKQLTAFPGMSSEAVAQIKKIAGEVGKLEAKLEAARSALMMKFKVTPRSTGKIDFNLQVDGKEPEAYHTGDPVEARGFQRLLFHDPGRLDIDITGSPAEVDIDALQKERERKQAELSERLNLMKAADIDRLDARFREYTALNNRKTEILAQINAMTTLDELMTRKVESEAELETLKTKEKEYSQQAEVIKQVEFLAMTKITQDHLDEKEKEIVALDKAIEEKRRNKTLLEGIQPGPGQQDVAAEAVVGASLTPQQTRDQINEMRTRLDELNKQWGQILGQRNREDFRQGYRLRKDEIDALYEEVSRLEPLELNTLKDVNSRVKPCEDEIERIAEEIAETSSKRARLSGEIEGFDAVVEEKNRVEYDHIKTLEGIKTHLIDIYALKLLLKVIEAEKEKAQQEIFKPLEERLVENLEQLIPGRYRPVIDNNFNLSIAASTFTGEYLEGVNESLSFGTREQLAFLLRLAIARQLSRKEPQVMILDDSFVNTDAERLPLILDMISRGSEGIQFLIFTCRENDYLQYKGRYHAIDLNPLLNVSGAGKVCTGVTI